MGGHPRGEIPQVPTPLSRRGFMLARQRIDDAAGRFTERLQDFHWAPIAPGGTAQPDGGGIPGDEVPWAVTSMGGRYIRCVAMRGVVASDFDFNGQELGAARLRIQLNGQNDFIGGNETGFSSFSCLFGSIKPAPPTISKRPMRCPWFWFVSPPLFRAGDLLTLTVHNASADRTLTPEVSLRLIDEELWQVLYRRDWRREKRRA